MLLNFTRIFLSIIVRPCLRTLKNEEKTQGFEAALPWQPHVFLKHVIVHFYICNIKSFSLGMLFSGVRGFSRGFICGAPWVHCDACLDPDRAQRCKL